MSDTDLLAPLWQLGDLTFGQYQKVGVTGFDPGATDIRTQDTEVPMADGMYMGRDWFNPSPWAFDLFTDADNEQEAHELAEQVARAWRNEGVRTTPGEVTTLRYRLNGRWRRVYGRPRRFSGTNGGIVTMQGNAEMTCDFQRVDHLHYDDEEQSATVGSIPATVGGFIFPAIFPLSTARWGEYERTHQVRVGGSAPTYPIFSITGPISAPEVQVGSIRLRLVGNVQAGQTVIVDTRPWKRTIRLRNGPHVPGLLHPATRLAQMALEPGYYEMVMAGRDLSGHARASVSWRDAYYSI